MKSERKHINLVGGGSSGTASKGKRKAKPRAGGRKRKMSHASVTVRKRARRG